MRLIAENHDHESPALRRFRAAGTGDLYATELDLSVSDDPARWGEAIGDSPRIILRCASFAAIDTPGDSPGDLSGDQAAAWLESWSESGWAAFSQRVARARQAADDRGVELLIRPGAGGMLSDGVCTLSWFARSAGAAPRLMLDPVGWITPSMVRDLDDHLLRIAERSHQLIDAGAVECVLLRSAGAVTGPGSSLDPRPLHDQAGADRLDPGLILRRLAPLT
ncbi:MAG: hypothetical protein WD114_00965, partial [Phycisphaerales bacterium]